MSKDKEVTMATEEQNIDLQLKKLQLAKLLAEQAKEEEKLEGEKASRATMARTLEKGRQERFAVQQACIHRKPNNETAFTGQRDWSGMTHFICQICHKMENDGTINPSLRPNPAIIGGPIGLMAPSA